MVTTQEPSKGRSNPRQENLVRAFKKLRQREGVTFKKLSVTPAVLEDPLVVAESSRTGASPEKAAFELLKAKVAELGVGRNARAAWYALNLEHKLADVLNVRRDQFVMHVLDGKGSTESVERYENEGFEELALSFVLDPGEKSPGGRSTDRTDSESESARDGVWESPWLVTAQNFHTIETEAVLRFDKGRVPSEMVVKRKVEALAHVDRYVIRFRYSRDTAERDCYIEMIEGGRLLKELPEAPLTGFRYFEIDLQKYLNSGDQHFLHYKVVIPQGSNEPDPYHTYASWGRRTSRAVLRCEFDPEDMPDKVDRIISVYSEFPVPAEPKQRLYPDENGHVASTFEELRAGYVYGLVWDFVL